MIIRNTYKSLRILVMLIYIKGIFNTVKLFKNRWKFFVCKKLLSVFISSKCFMWFCKNRFHLEVKSMDAIVGVASVFVKSYMKIFVFR